MANRANESFVEKSVSSDSGAIGGTSRPAISVANSSSGIMVAIAQRTSIAVKGVRVLVAEVRFAIVSAKYAGESGELSQARDKRYVAGNAESKKSLPASLIANGGLPYDGRTTS